MSIVTTQEKIMICISKTCRQLLVKIIKFKASQLWHQLPNEIKEIKSESLFKSRIKVYLY